MTSVFIDTNILIHFKSFDQIDWNEITGDKEIQLVFAPIVIEELDKHKRNNKPLLKGRARRVLQKIRDLVEEQGSENIRISEHVGLVICEKPNHKLYKGHNLDRQEKDHRLIATILDYPVPNQTILVTDDTGLYIAGKTHQIDTMLMPEAYKLAEEEDPHIKQNRELNKRIQLITNQLPDLKLCFDNSKINNDFTVKRPDWISGDTFVSREMKKIVEKYTQMEYSKPKNTILGSNLDRLNNHFAPSEDQIRNYNHELEKFIEKHKMYLRAEYDFLYKMNLTISFKLSLTNIGTIPAEDIDIQMHFPDGFELTDSLGQNEPVKPKPPIRPTSRLLPYSSSSSILAASQQMNFHPPSFPIDRLSIKKTNSYDVSYPIQYLKHHNNRDLPEMHLIFDGIETAKNFKVTYKISAANLPTIQSGELNFKIKIE